MFKSILASIALSTALTSAAIAEPTIAPYDYEYLTVQAEERAKTSDNVATQRKIFKEGIFARNWDRMRELYADNYVQHSANMTDGKEGVIDLFKSLDYSTLVYERKMTIAEGPYIIGISKARLAPDASELIVVDINFIRDGKSREHWDILMPISGKPNPSGRTPFDSVYKDKIKVDPATIEANKKLVADFFNVIANQKRADLIRNYLGEPYYQHGSGPDGAEDVAKDVRTVFADAEIDTKRIISQNDLVVAHTRVSLAGKAFSRVDIFRARGGKLVEHWSAMQEVPKTMKHSNGMF